MLSLTRYEKLLVLIFILSLPLSNPWVRGDGVGYYAFVRSMLIEHRLDFTRDWTEANTSFRQGRFDANGTIDPSQITQTGQLDNHFSVGPAILWAPFLVVAHAGVLLSDRFGAHVAADGYSRPYLIAMALATALYGFTSIIVSFRISRRFVAERWAFLAAFGIWWASSFPVYMYFNPSWSHAMSSFVVAIFVWYWLRTRENRAFHQWAVLGAFGGLAMDVYYLNAILVVFPALESLVRCKQALATKTFSTLAAGNLLFATCAFLAFLPTLLTKKLIYGSYLDFGYRVHWYFRSPAFLKVSFSPDHGAFSWTPVLLLGTAGLFALYRYDRALALYSLAALFAYIYALGCYSDWDGISSFGSRFLISLTPLFVLGLAALFERMAHAWQSSNAAILASALTAILIAWNFGLMFQWGTHLIPARGSISWRDAAYNQVAVVPREALSTFSRYLTRRQVLMHQIEEEDVRQMKGAEAGSGSVR